MSFGKAGASPPRQSSSNHDTLERTRGGVVIGVETYSMVSKPDGGFDLGV